MKSYRTFTGAGGGLTVLPTLEESARSEYSEEESESSTNTSSSCSEDYPQGTATSYPTDLLGVSWGSYLYSGPPTRAGAHDEPSSPARKIANNSSNQVSTTLEHITPANTLQPNQETSQDVVESCRQNKISKPQGSKGTEPHPLLQHLEGLVSALITSRKELTKYGMDVTHLTPLSDNTLASHYDLKKIMGALSTQRNCNEVIISSDLLHNLVEYLREVINGLVKQGKKMDVQAGFLERMAKQLNRNQQKYFDEQREVQESIINNRAQLDIERKELEKQRISVNKAKEELKKMLLEVANSSEKDRRSKRDKGRMGSPHTIAQGQSQLAALSKTQKQQSRLEKTLIQQQRDIRNLQQAHHFTKSELLAVQEHATKLQRRLTKQINEVKNSEAALTTRLFVTRKSLVLPSMALDEEKRKSYGRVSTAQVKATLKGITATQKTLGADIERMHRQFSEQYKTGQRISRQLEESHLELEKTSSQLRQHATSISRTNHTHHSHNEETGSNLLPKITQTSHGKKQRTSSEVSFSLPHLHQSSYARIPGSTSRQYLPKYRFSRTELLTLAKFDDHETAKQVTEWLQQQGKLTE